MINFMICDAYIIAYAAVTVRCLFLVFTTYLIWLWTLINNIFIKILYFVLQYLSSCDVLETLVINTSSNSNK